MVMEYVLGGLAVLAGYLFIVKVQKDSPVAPITQRFKRYEYYVNFSQIETRGITRGRMAGANAIRRKPNGLVDVYYYSSKGILGGFFSKLEKDIDVDPRKIVRHTPPYTAFPEGQITVFPTTWTAINKTGGGVFYKELVRYCETINAEIEQLWNAFQTVNHMMETQTDYQKARELMNAGMEDLDNLRKSTFFKTQDNKSTYGFIESSKTDGSNQNKTEAEKPKV